MSKHIEMKVKTKQAIIDSFWKLIKLKGLNKITVSSIMKDAGYNRGTFYEYFKDIPDLLEQIEDEMIEDLSIQIADKLNCKLPFDLQTLSHECASILGKFDDRLFFLLSENCGSSFSYRFKNKFINEITNYFDFGEKDCYKDYIIAYCYSALVGIRLHWYENGKKLDFEEVVNITQTLIATGLFGFIKQDYIK